MDSIRKDIANIVVEKTIRDDGKTYTRFPVGIILKAMDVVHYVVKPTESVKK